VHTRELQALQKQRDVFPTNQGSPSIRLVVAPDRRALLTMHRPATSTSKDRSKPPRIGGPFDHAVIDADSPFPNFIFGNQISCDCRFLTGTAAETPTQEVLAPGCHPIARNA
jgi:hypothetical protein